VAITFFRNYEDCFILGPSRLIMKVRNWLSVSTMTDDNVSSKKII